MLMNSKTIHFETMKNDTPGFNDESNKKAIPGCDSGDCSIRVLSVFNTAIGNKKHVKLLISRNNFENNGGRKKNC